MTRKKYFTHKGRNRHFTSVEQLKLESAKKSEQISRSTEQEQEEEENEQAAAKGSFTPIQPKEQKPAARKSISSCSEADTDQDTNEFGEIEARGDKKGVAALIKIENPNRVARKASVKISQLNIDIVKPTLSRREREEIEEQTAHRRYQKLHAGGKTSEAISDLARLALIRYQREQAAAKREADKKAAALGKKPTVKQC